MLRDKLLIFFGTAGTAIFLFFSSISIILTYSGLIMSVTSLVIGIIGYFDNKKTSNIIISENRLQHHQILESIEKEEKKEVKELRASKSKLIQLMDKVTSELQKEHLSKTGLLSKLDSPAHALLIHKTKEADEKNSDKVKPVRDEIFPKLGLKYIKGNRGVYVLPPSKTPQFSNKKDIELWVKRNILDKLPKGHKLILSFVSLVDLRFTFSIKRDKYSKRFVTLFDELDTAELVDFSSGLSYLQNKKNLSLKDLIEIPNINFLSEGTSFDLAQIELLKKNNDKIVKDIEQAVGVKDIKTSNLSSINTETLYSIIKKTIPTATHKDAELIKRNAEFWVRMFNKTDFSEFPL